ncbi:MAG: hypothetical protein AAF586_07575 [Planctomycetota bacterium]
MELPFTLMVPTDVEAGYLKGLRPMKRCGVGESAGSEVVSYTNLDLDEDPTLPRCLVLAGFAGGLVDGLAVGDVVVPNHVQRPGHESRVVEHLACTGHGLVMAERVVTRSDAKRELHRQTGADVADMEGHCFAEWCEDADLDWLIVRAVSDAVDDALPEPIGDWVTPEGRTRVSAAMKWAGFRPGRLAELSRLKARADKAGAALRAAVIRLAETWPPAASPD